MATTRQAKLSQQKDKKRNRPSWIGLPKRRSAAQLQQHTEESGSQSSYLMLLPNEILLHLLSYLTKREILRVTKVCRLLRQLALDSPAIVRRPVLRCALQPPRFSLSQLEADARIPVLEFLRKDGFVFIHLHDDDLDTIRNMKKLANKFFRRVEGMSFKKRSKMFYSLQQRVGVCTGYAETEELHAYQARLHSGLGDYPWENASKRERETGVRYWLLMARINYALLRNVSISLGIPFETVYTLCTHNARPRALNHPQHHQDAALGRWRCCSSYGLEATSTEDEAEEETLELLRRWTQPLMRMYHFREGLHIPPNFDTGGTISAGLFRLVTAFNDGGTPCGLQMLLPMPKRAGNKRHLPIFKLATEGDIAVFAGNALRKLCRPFGRPPLEPVVSYWGNVGARRSKHSPRECTNSTFLEFDSLVTFEALEGCMKHIAALKEIPWNPRWMGQESNDSAWIQRQIDHHQCSYAQAPLLNPFWYNSTQAATAKHEERKLKRRRAMKSFALAALVVPVIMPMILLS